MMTLWFKRAMILSMKLCCVKIIVELYMSLKVKRMEINLRAMHLLKLERRWEVKKTQIGKIVIPLNLRMQS